VSAVVPIRTDLVGEASGETLRRGAAEPDPVSVVRLVVGARAFLERQGIARVLECAADIEIVAWPSSELETLAAVEREAPDVVVVDLSLAPTHTDEGIRLARRLRAEHPSVGVVVLSPGTRPEHAVRFFASGARGRAYLLTGQIEGSQELLGAIREVALGGTVVHPAVVDVLVHADQDDGASRLDRLTARELEVLSLLAGGLSNAAVAEQLSLTKRAVEKHVGEIFARLGLHDDAGISRRVTAALLFLGAAGSLVDEPRAVARVSSPAPRHPPSSPAPSP
jgi:DNA-binding NarL/FixJ family response regulator